MSRTLFLLYTCKKNLLKAKACLKSWAHREKELIVISDEILSLQVKQEIIPSFGYQRLAEKTCLMWEMISAKYLNNYDYFIKVDDDTFVFTNNLKRKLRQESVDFFGNWERWRSSDPNIIKWVAGSFYGLSVRSLQLLAKGLQDPSDRNAFTSRGSAEDVAVSVLLAKKGIVPARWPGMFVHERRKTIEAMFLRPREPLSVTNLSKGQMQLFGLFQRVWLEGLARPFLH